MRNKCPSCGHVFRVSGPELTCQCPKCGQSFRYVGATDSFEPVSVNRPPCFYCGKRPSDINSVKVVWMYRPTKRITGLTFGSHLEGENITIRIPRCVPCKNETSPELTWKSLLFLCIGLVFWIGIFAVASHIGSLFGIKGFWGWCVGVLVGFVGFLVGIHVLGLLFRVTKFLFGFGWELERPETRPAPEAKRRREDKDFPEVRHWMENGWRIGKVIEDKSLSAYSND